MFEAIRWVTGEQFWSTMNTVVPILLAVVIGTIAIEVIVYLFLKHVLRTKHALPYTLLAPALLAIVLFYIYPLTFNVMLAFSDLGRDTLPCYSGSAARQVAALAADDTSARAVQVRAQAEECSQLTYYSLENARSNFTRVFVRVDGEGNPRLNADGTPIFGRLLSTENSTFPNLLGRTLIWTFVNVFFHITVGMIIALVLNQNIVGKGIYRALIVIPWAIPQVIAALTWKQEFHAQYGFVNAMLMQLGIIQEGIGWLEEPNAAFAAVTFVNIWLGIPFYMVTLLGGLQSISKEYYEAAQMDGAGPVQQFINVTLPLLRPIMVPITTLDVIWTFNMINVIQLITGGGPSESTNILVTALYNAAFGQAANFQLGFAAAFSIVIFAILFIFALVWMRIGGGLKDIYAN
jgi:arabinogalactan oligomer / maltooligosaccharide transport system permease protein